MPNITAQRVRKGLFRLLNGPRDVDRWDAHLVPIDRAIASHDHRQLFERYCNELGPAVAKAAAVWDGELKGWAAEGRTAEAADKEMWTTYPAGPAAQPFFVALVRRYWLACDALNQTVPADQGVPPEHFLLGWLHDDPRQEEPMRVLACMPYWPMGIDAKGRWL
jgi:hypothetical protein